METATPQDRLDAIQARLTTVSGLAAEMAAALADKDAEIERTLQSLTSSITEVTETLAVSCDRLRDALDDLGPRQELLREGVLAPVGEAIESLFNELGAIR